LNINAKYFGPISYEKKETIHIINGLIGFENHTEYLPISFQEDDDSMISLQCLDDEALSFILLNPFGIFPDYDPVLPKYELEELGTDFAVDIPFYVIGVIRDSVAESTINLKAPLAVNALNRRAKQVILDHPEYTFRHFLGDMRKEG